MIRNFDLAALRSFLAVADTGGVTRAAAAVNLTQSAVSMQIRRLETFVGTALLDRAGRGVALTPAGDQLLAYARRILALNDEAWGRLTAPDYSGRLTLGVPHDIVHQAIPQVLRGFAAAYPRVKVDFVSSFTIRLKERFARGEIDIILTTENHAAPEAEILAQLPLVWVGAAGGQIWRQQPLRLAFEDDCVFRKAALRRLDEEGIAWEMAVGSNSTRAVEVAVSADLAIHAMIDGSEQRLFFEKVPHGGALPALWDVNVNMYVATLSPNPAREALAEAIRQAYRRLPGAQPIPVAAAAGATVADVPVAVASRGTAPPDTALHGDHDLSHGLPLAQKREA